MIPSDSTAFQRVRCHQDDADTRTRSRFKTTTSTRLLSSPAINFSRYCHPGTICVRRFNGYIFLLLVLLNLCPIRANPDAKRLYDDLLSNYNRLIRPVYNNTDTVLVRLGLRLSQLLDLVRLSNILTFYIFYTSLPHKMNSIAYKYKLYITLLEIVNAVKLHNFPS